MLEYRDTEYNKDLVAILSYLEAFLEMKSKRSFNKLIQPLTIKNKEDKMKVDEHKRKVEINITNEKVKELGLRQVNVLYTFMTGSNVNVDDIVKSLRSKLGCEEILFTVRETAVKYVH